ncbi:MAG: sigma-70 family RNA polymerase sigma factor [Planctomycetaceae bacterium]
MAKPDHELISESLRGQTHAFGELVVRYQNRLYNGLVHIVGSSEEARDVAQDAFVKAFQKLHTFGGRSAFYSWLFRIALNAAVSRQRKLNRRPASIDSLRDRQGVEPVDQRAENRPGFSLEASERQAAVQRALAQLPEEFRTVLILKEMDDLKYEEIAEVVGCPVGTVRSRIHRARAELREKLTVMLQEPGAEEVATARKS